MKTSQYITTTKYQTYLSALPAATCASLPLLHQPKNTGFIKVFRLLPQPRLCHVVDCIIRVNFLTLRSFCGGAKIRKS